MFQNKVTVASYAQPSVTYMSPVPPVFHTEATMSLTLFRLLFGEEQRRLKKDFQT